MREFLTLFRKLGLDVGTIERSSQHGIDFQGSDFVYRIKGTVTDLIKTGTGEYRAKLEGSFIRFRNLSSSDGNSFWELTDKNGVKYLFGQTDSSRTSDPASPKNVCSWHLDRIDDTSANFMEIKYVKDQGSVYLSTLSYTGHKDLTPQNIIEFILEPRPDAETSYATGFLTITAKRLKAITVSSGQHLVRAYALNYKVSASTKRSLLSSLAEYGSDAVIAASGTISSGSSFPPHTFDYASQSVQFAPAITSGNLDWGYPEGGRAWTDFNGDGRADFCRVVGSQNGVSSYVRCTLSTGTGFGQEITSGVIDWGFPESRTWVDVNGDGRADFCRVVGIAGQFEGVKCLLSTGTGFGADIQSGNLDWGYPEGGRAWTDFNGDGRADFCRVVGSQNGVSSYVRCTLSTGTGFGQEITSGVIDWGYPESRAWVDVNGDGRADFCRVVGVEGNYSIKCLLSMGNAFGDDITVGPLDRGYAQGRAWADFTGSGKPSFCRVVGTAGTFMGIQITPVVFTPTDALTSEDNGLGTETDITYSPSTVFQNTLLPFAMPLVSSIRSKDAAGVDGTTVFSYEGGYFNLLAHEFRGFNRVKVRGPIDSNGMQRIDETWFHQGNDLGVDKNDPSVAVGYMKGKPYRQTTTDANGHLYTEESLIYSLSTTEPYFTPVQEIDKQVCDGGPCDLMTKTTYEYDEFGNITREYDYGDVSTPAKARTIARTFTYNKDAWLVSLVTEESLYKGIGLGTKVKGTTYKYDSAASCTDVPSNVMPTRGLLTEIIPWSHMNDQAGARIAYDEFGNPACKLDPNRNATTFAFDAQHTYLRKVTNAKNQTVETRYYGVDAETVAHGLVGQVMADVDANGATTVTQYDALGRKTYLARPANLGWTKWSYVLIGTPLKQHVEALSSDAMEESDYFDGQGRMLSLRRTGPDQKTIGIDNVFDSRSLLVRTSNAYYVGLETPLFKKISYDAMSRLILITNPDGSSSSQCFAGLVTVTINENGHRKRETDDVNGHVVKIQEYRGIFQPKADSILAPYSCDHSEAGEPVPLAENAPAGTQIPQGLYATTSYEYDTVGNLVATVDAKGNRSSSEYDSLGRKISAKDPDLGQWLYDYDPNGNLVKQTDASQQVTFFTHDELNRIVQRDYQVKHKLGKGDVVFEYDDGTYGKGRLTRERNQYSDIAYEYDAAGRQTVITKQILGRNYVTSLSFDASDRVRGVTYPDGSTITNIYDGPFLKSISDSKQVYFQAALVNASGQPVSVTYGNGITTNYSYHDGSAPDCKDQSLRLCSIEVVDSRHQPLGALHYQYDRAGNITELSNLKGDGKLYAYDSLERLIASGDFTSLPKPSDVQLPNEILLSSNPANYWKTLTLNTGAVVWKIGYNYDETGDVSWRSDLGSYSYPASGADSVRPHAVTGIGKHSLIYDSNGALRRDGARTLSYDRELRLNATIVGNVVTTFAYDSEGERIHKSVGASSTVYVDKYFECSENVCTKFVFAGQQRVAAIQGRRSNTCIWIILDRLSSLPTDEEKQS